MSTKQEHDEVSNVSAAYKQQLISTLLAGGAIVEIKEGPWHRLTEIWYQLCPRRISVYSANIIDKDEGWVDWSELLMKINTNSQQFWIGTPGMLQDAANKLINQLQKVEPTSVEQLTPLIRVLKCS